MSKFDTTRIVIRPEVQTNYTPRGTKVIKFFIPPSLGFVDTQDLVLRSDIQFSGGNVGVFRPNPRAGMSSLYRSLIVRSGNNEATLEDIQSYNSLCASVLDYSANDSIQALRNMTEGFDRGNKSFTDSLFFKDNNIFDDEVTTARESNTLQTEMPFHMSGVLGSGKTFPVSATGGLRVELELDDIGRTLMPFGPSEITTNATIVSGSFVNNTPDYTITFGQPYDKDLLPSWTIGTKLYLALFPPGVESLEGRQVVEVGNIEELIYDADGNFLFKVKLSLPEGQTWPPPKDDGTQLTWPIGSVFYADPEQQLNGYTTANQPISGSNVTTPAMDYTLSNLELVMNRVVPPEGYVKAMMAKIASSGGLTMDYRTWTLHRNNLAGTTGMLSQSIPATNTLAYSILSTPYDQLRYSSAGSDNFEPDTDGIVEYQYFVSDVATPTRAVQMKRYAQIERQPEMLHLRELEKALVNAGVDVRNLPKKSEPNVNWDAHSAHRVKSAILSDSNIRLQTLYQLPAHLTSLSQKVFDNNVCYCATMNVKDGVVSVDR